MFGHLCCLRSCHQDCGWCCSCLLPLSILQGQGSPASLARRRKQNLLLLPPADVALRAEHGSVVLRGCPCLFVEARWLMTLYTRQSSICAQQSRAVGAQLGGWRGQELMHLCRGRVGYVLASISALESTFKKIGQKWPILGRQIQYMSVTQQKKKISRNHRQI